jgi:hypothetical protein
LIDDELIDWLMRARGYPTNQTNNPPQQQSIIFELSPPTTSSLHPYTNNLNQPTN